MKKILFEMMMIFFVFLIGTANIIMLDNICFETTGQGGKLVLDVENCTLFQ